MTQIDLIARPAFGRRAAEEARARRDIGVLRAADRADRAAPGWTAIALERVAAFVRPQVGMFTIEQMRAVLAAEIPAPTDLRAWGKVTQMALRRGLIEHTGRTAPAATSNMAGKPLYKRGAPRIAA